jgi:glyoxylase-like metal-dependent hydrolase (beta-lactamase superfamily II)
VDTGLGLPDAEARWALVFAQLDGPVERIVVTHFHPDHVGGSGDVADLTGAPVHQGRIDYEYCVRAWGNDAASDPHVADNLRAHGVEEAEVEAISAHHRDVVGLVRYARDPTRLDDGDRVDDWEVLHLPGHADGHICLLRDGVLVAGDALLGDITPNIGIFPGSNPDPLADYLSTLERVIELAPRIAYPGHGEPIRDPAGRARRLIEHHRGRLDLTQSAVADGPRTGSQAAFALFPDALSPPLRRFAIAETLAHLEHLVYAGRAERVETEGTVAYRT